MLSKGMCLRVLGNSLGVVEGEEVKLGEEEEIMTGVEAEDVVEEEAEAEEEEEEEMTAETVFKEGEPDRLELDDEERTFEVAREAKNAAE
jgi:hypothetical protein